MLLSNRPLSNIIRSSRLIVQRLSMLIAPPNSPASASDCPLPARTSPARLAAKHTLLTHVHFAVRPHARLPFIVIPMHCATVVPRFRRSYASDDLNFFTTPTSSRKQLTTHPHDSSLESDEPAPGPTPGLMPAP